MRYNVDMGPQRSHNVARAALVCLVILGSGCAAELRDSLSVCTINVAHGRGPGAIPGLPAVVTREACEGHLRAIARVLRREDPDVVALQEADAPSAWSGEFDHVTFLSDAASLYYREHGLHVQTTLRYGTALLARQPLTGRASHAFKTGVLDTKGYVLAQLEFAGRPVTVVSVHLDFRIAAIRLRQARALVDRLRKCETPLIVMGDFNCDWDAGDDALRFIAEQLNLQACQPTSDGLETYPAGRPRKRLDWILISEELEFAAYGNLPDRLSDHMGVYAETGWR